MDWNELSERPVHTRIRKMPRLAPEIDETEKV